MIHSSYSAGIATRFFACGSSPSFHGDSPLPVPWLEGRFSNLRGTAFNIFTVVYTHMGLLYVPI